MSSGQREARAPRTRRTQNYWEPIYQPKAADLFPYGLWSDAQKQGATQKTLDANDLLPSGSPLKGFKFKGLSFTTCDFFGPFDRLNRTFVFEDCTFFQCDFGLTTWKRAKFTNCKFSYSSFTQSTWIECEFRGCTWEHVGLSGNETRLERTYIDNPSAFIDAAHLMIDEQTLSAYKRTRNGQLVKYWETKSVVARQLYNDLKQVGDEGAFYDSCKAFISTSYRYRFEKLWRPEKRRDGVVPPRNPFALGAALLDLAFVRLVASINKWGESVSRPLLLLAAIFVVFGLFYHIAHGIPIFASYAKSFEVTSIAGYTRAVAPTTSKGLRLTEWANLLASLLVYTVLISTIVAKVCRVR